MNLKQLAKVAAKATNASMGNSLVYTTVDAELILEKAFQQLTAALARGESVKLRGFGTFERRKYDDRQIMNPGTKTTEKLASRYAVKFIPSGSLKDAVRGDLL